MSDEKRESFSETESHETDDLHLSVSRRRRLAPSIYGIMGEFDNPSDLVAAARRTYEAGYRRVNGYSPYPIEELDEAIGFKRTSLPLIVLNTLILTTAFFVFSTASIIIWENASI